MPRGAKSLLTPARRKKIVGYVADGLTQKSAFILSGVHEQTGAQWMRRGKDDIAAGDSKTPHALLVLGIAEAKGQFENMLMKKITIVESKVDAFTFLKYMHEQENKRLALQAEQQGGMGGYTPPQTAD